MIRHLLCKSCAKDRRKGMHPEDIAAGWHERTCHISAVTPLGHGITINGKFCPLESLRCDWCNEPITGQTVLARTQWRGPEPHQWESEYGPILPPEAVEAEERLTR